MELHKYFDPDSPEYVVLHAMSQVQRRRRPSCNFRGILNPRLALEKAKSEINATGFNPIRHRPMTFNDAVRVIESLNTPRVLHIELTPEEFDKMLKAKPVEIEDGGGILGFKPGGGLFKGGLRTVEFDWVSQKPPRRWAARMITRVEGIFAD